MSLKSLEELERLRRTGYTFKELWSLLLSSPNLLKLLDNQPDKILEVFPHWNDSFDILKPITDIDSLALFLYEWLEVPESLRNSSMYSDLPTSIPLPLRKVYQNFHWAFEADRYSKNEGYWRIFDYRQNEFFHPNELSLDFMFPFLCHSQGAILYETFLGLDDPPVVEIENMEPFDDYGPLYKSLEHFLISHILSECSEYGDQRTKQKYSNFEAQKLWKGKYFLGDEFHFYRISTDSIFCTINEDKPKIQRTVSLLPQDSSGEFYIDDEDFPF